MHQICIIFCAVLSHIYGGSAHKYMYKEGQEVTVNCDPKQPGTITFWFQINRSGARYLFTVKSTDVKFNANPTKYKVNTQNGKVSLAIQSFEKKTDSGLYTCAAMNNNKLFFGELTEINGEPDPATQLPKIAPTEPKPMVTTEKIPCTCIKQDPKPIFNCCETWIVSSLACGCVLLLNLLIITILYCKHLRTSHCPHNHIKQPQTRPADHAELLDTPF